jgi:hypothetical protein
MFVENYGEARVVSHSEFVLGVGLKAKTVTNNLPILSALAFVVYYVIYMKTRHIIN